MSSMLGASFQAVSKVIVAVLVGAFTCNYIPHTSTTMRDFSFMISSVFLPSLTVANTAKSVNIEVLVRCSILLIFGVLIVFIGIGSAVVMARMLFRVNKANTGIPVELVGDVRLDLLYDTTDDTDSNNNKNNKKKESASSSSSSKGKHRKKGTPYVAVILSEKLRSMGIDGRDVVAALDVPHVELQEHPFYYWGAWVACSIQNAVTLPLSLFQNLTETVPWLSYSEGTAYIFVFSITASVYIWAFGPIYVETAQKRTVKQRLIAEMIAQHKRMHSRCDAVTQTDISYTAAHDVLAGGALRDRLPDDVVRQTEDADAPPPSWRRDTMVLHPDPAPLPSVRDAEVHVGDGSRSTGTQSGDVSPRPEVERVDMGEQTETPAWSPATARHFSFPELGCAQQLPYDWESAGFVRVRYEGQLKDPGGPDATERALRTTKQVSMRLITSMPFMSIVVGVVIGVIPPLRALFFDDGPLEMITDAVTLIGQGSIPASLLLLGANLVGSTVAAKETAEAVRMRDSEQNTDFPRVPADDELLEDVNRFAEWYTAAHENIEFDVHASFSLHSLLQRQAAERIAVARAEIAAAEARRRAAAAAEEEREEREEREGGGAAGVKADAEPAALASGGMGVELGAAPGADDPPGGADAAAAAAEEAGGFMTEVKRALSLDGVRKRFVWGVILERLVITPALGFLLLIAMIKTMPFLFGGAGTMDRTLLVVLFMELAAPTAINSTLLFNQREYMTYQWAKMLFFQYLLCTVTMVAWATVGLEFVSRYT